VADPGTPFCNAAQFTSGALADLAAYYVQATEQPLDDILLEGTRLCEDMCGRRLAPFTLTSESHRAEGVDPDELGETGGIPISQQGTLGLSYAGALNNVTLVRHVQLDEYPVRYPDMWAYSDVSLSVQLAYGGTPMPLNPGQFFGPDADSGHIWFQLGTFLPIGSMVYATYSGGYSVAVPMSLVRANKYQSAALIMRELNPEGFDHDPGLLEADAEKIMGRWGRA
jgi:hypothetical protein